MISLEHRDAFPGTVGEPSQNKCNTMMMIGAKRGFYRPLNNGTSKAHILY
ncbi:MAG TPA: hypothetical protein QF887_08340 [SAR324 cluster bacterium]|nr:hypothetical protein [SAR324 cluster bacterium]